MFDRMLVDFYLGVRKEWKIIPWTVISVAVIWLLVAAVYIFIYPALAKSGDLSPLNSRLNYIIIKQFDSEIMAAQKDYCKADTKDFFASRLIELKRQYRDLTNNDYPLMPNCQELK